MQHTVYNKAINDTWHETYIDIITYTHIQNRHCMDALGKYYVDYLCIFPVCIDVQPEGSA